MLSSSSTTSATAGSRNRAAATTHAACAARTSRSLSCVSQVNPSPITWYATSGKRRKNSSSPVEPRPLMNCTTPTRIPWPSARASIPKAEELFPLPLPVNTRRTPRSEAAAAIRASTTAFRRRIRSRWRDACDESCGGGVSAGIGFHRCLRSPREHGLQQRGNACVHERNSDESGVPVRDALPPAAEAGVGDAAAQPVKGRMGHQEAKRRGKSQTRRPARQVGGLVPVCAAHPGTSQPQERIRRQHEYIGYRHTVAADTEVFDDDEVH